MRSQAHPVAPPTDLAPAAPFFAPCLGSLTPATITFFFFNDTATTEIYTLSLHDALPIYYFVRASPLHGRLARTANRIEFTVSAHSGERRYGRSVDLPFLPTPLRNPVSATFPY